MQTETIYQTLFWVGVFGVGVMGMMSAGSHGGDDSSGADGYDGGGGDASDVGDAGHDGGGAEAFDAGHTADVALAQDGGAPHDAGTTPDGETHYANAGHAAGILARFMTVFSPMALFSLSLGGGATGMLLKTRLPVLPTAILALIGGVAFYTLVVRPLLKLMRRFVSKPATTLAGIVAGEAVAQNRFDARGHGIVQVEIDEQVVRLLAYLEREDHAKGITVAPDDTLVVTKIDEATNTCHVTKL